MSRLLSAMKIDLKMQVRNKLYTIGIGLGMLVAVILSQLIRSDQLSSVIPTILLLVTGGSAILYVAGMIIFERDEGTLNAVIVSPLRTSEYLCAKIITLTALATLESVIMVAGAMLIMGDFGSMRIVDVPMLLIGIVAIGMIYTLVGIVVIVRYEKITDFLIPVSVVAIVLQIPFLYFWKVIIHPVFLFIPTSAPAVLMQGAFVPLTAWEWCYAVGYTAVTLVGLTIWAYRAFNRYIIMKIG